MNHLVYMFYVYTILIFEANMLRHWIILKFKMLEYQGLGICNKIGYDCQVNLKNLKIIKYFKILYSWNKLKIWPLYMLNLIWHTNVRLYASKHKNNNLMYNRKTKK